VPIAVYLEEGAKRVFACAFDWPGWCRSGKNEEQAMAALKAYASRYAIVAKKAGMAFPKTDRFEIVERLAGSATTDFGAPGAIAVRDRRPPTAKEADRLAALVAAAWAVFDDVVAGAPAELRKGPRGGGRDRDVMVQHVMDAEGAYVRKLGARGGREQILGALRAASKAPMSERGWPAPYAARRIAWHALDHAWEMEDRS
jgi:hypothetical protein